MYPTIIGASSMLSRMYFLEDYSTTICAHDNMDIIVQVREDCDNLVFKYVSFA
jgi:hypothetical protein